MADVKEPVTDQAPDATAAATVVVTDPDELDLGYRIQLDAFSGPMDLLLYLVRRSEVDIADVKIEEIADQFLATLQSWDELNLDIAGDFILMAASLLEIKARMAVPPDDNTQDEEEEDLIDPRAELIQQLLQFKKFKEATQLLQELEDNNLLVHQRKHHEQIPESDDQEQYNLENADAYQLFVMWDNILVSISGKRPRTIVFDDIPIEQRVKQVMQTMQRALEGQLDWLFSTVKTRIQKIGVFVAVLECVRKSYLEAIQHEQYGSVYLRYKEDDERAANPVLPPEIDTAEKSKRRRRRQLVTYRVPEDQLQSEDLESEEGMLDEDELIIETDEQRFLRELNAETEVDALLAIGRDLDGSIQRHLYEQGVIEEIPLEENDAGAEALRDEVETVESREEVDFDDIAGSDDDDEFDDDDDDDDDDDNDLDDDDDDEDDDDDDDDDDDEFDDDEEEYDDDDDDDDDDEYDDDDDDDD